MTPLVLPLVITLMLGNFTLSASGTVTLPDGISVDPWVIELAGEIDGPDAHYDFECNGQYELGVLDMRCVLPGLAVVEISTVITLRMPAESRIYLPFVSSGGR